MNDQTKDQPDIDVAPVAAKSEASQEAQESPSADAKSLEKDAPVTIRSSSALAWVALFAALIAIGGIGYVWSEQQAQRTWEGRINALRDNQELRDAESNRVLDRVESLAQQDQRLDDELSALVARQEARFAAVLARIDRLESLLEKLPGVSDRARTVWLRAEAEYFLRIANAQLNLAGNVSVSLHALELADEQLRTLADPAMMPVREAISDERTALQAVPQPDAEGIVLQLGSLTRALAGLSLAQIAPDRFEATGSGDTNETGLARAWRVIVDALKSIISVKREDREIVPLMTAAEESMLIRSLEIDLQIARLAVIRNEGELYRSALNTVSDRLRSYFDMSSPDVAAALSTLDELALAELPEQLPDISGSLTLLLKMPAEGAI